MSVNSESVTVSLYNSSFTYSLGDMCFYNSIIYKSLQNSNTNNTPVAVSAYWQSPDKLFGTTEISIPASSTSDEIQALIDSVPKDLNGNLLTFQFADGTYTFNKSLLFTAFKGGSVRVYGNTTETNATILHTSQSVHIDASSWDGAAGEGGNSLFLFQYCSCRIYFQNLKITIPDESCTGLRIREENMSYLRYNYFLASGKTAANYGIYCIGGTQNTNANYFSNLTYGMRIESGIAYSNGNDSTGTDPTYGLSAIVGARIAKNGAQPTGSTADENTATFGEIG